jgi:superfamily I DNA/RNA helicase
VGWRVRRPRRSSRRGLNQLRKKLPPLPGPVNIEALPVDFNRLFDLDHVTFVYGVPGSGKTRKLLELFNTTRSTTVFITFTTSARSGAAERSESGKKAFMTLHSIALKAVARTLDKPTNEILPCVDENLNPQTCTFNGPFDAEKSIRELQRRICKIYDIPYSMDPYLPSDGNQLFQYVNYVLNIGGLNALNKYMNELPPVYEGALRQYYDWLEKHERFDFALLLVKAIELNATFAVCNGKDEYEDCEQPRVVFVDEVQDFGPLFFNALFSLFPKAREFVFAGDPNQTIYHELNGASFELTMSLYETVRKLQDSGRGEVIYLDKSVRVPSKIADFAKKYFQAHKINWSSTKEGGNVVHDFNDNLGIIVTKLVNKYTHPVSILVLAYDNRHVIEAMRTLLAYGITPYGLKERTPNIVINFLKDVEKFVETNLPPVRRDSSLYPYYEHGYYTFKSKYEDMKSMPGHENLKISDFMKDIIDKYKYYKPNIFEPQITTVFVDTVHAAKGLEAQDVVIYNHTISKKTKVPVEVKYVAATRAKNDLYIVHTRGPYGIQRGWFT